MIKDHENVQIISYPENFVNFARNFSKIFFLLQFVEIKKAEEMLMSSFFR